MENINELKRPIDHLPERPLVALEMIWNMEDIEVFLHGEIRYWFYMALSHEGSVYACADIDIRAKFIEFYSDLVPFIEATYLYNIRTLYFAKNRTWPSFEQIILFTNSKLCHEYSYPYTSAEEAENPHSALARFCLKYTASFCRQVLWHFLDAVEFYAGPFRKRVSVHAFAHYYMKLLTLVEIGYVLTEKGN